MNFNSFISTKNALLLTPTVLFSIFPVMAIWVLIYQDPAVINLSNAGLLFPYLISFCGSVKLLYSFPEKPSFRKYIIPFSVVTAGGILICLIRLFSPGTLFAWPLIPFADLLIFLSNLLLTPAITLLLIPFVTDVKETQKFSFNSLLFLSIISGGISFIIFIQDILPLLDPEFIWSKFWDFGIPNMLINNLLYGLYFSIGMPIVGLLSIFVIRGHLINNSPSEGRRR